MKQIRDWLAKDAPYAEGLALYETHGKSRVVLKSLQYGETTFTRATLRRELAKLVGEAPEKPVRSVSTSAERVLETPKSVQVAPDDQVLSQRRTWYATRAHLHAQLELVATDGERLGLSEQILALSAQLAASYAAQVPAVAAPADELAALEEPGEIRRLLGNLRPQRSKLQKNPARAGDLGPRSGRN